MKNQRLNYLLEDGSQCNLVSEILVDEIILETYNLMHPSLLAWLQGKSFMTITKRYKIKICINANCLYELNCPISLLETYEVIFGGPYTYGVRLLLAMIGKKCHLVKGGNIVSFEKLNIIVIYNILGHCSSLKNHTHKM